MPPTAKGSGNISKLIPPENSPEYSIHVKFSYSGEEKQAYSIFFYLLKKKYFKVVQRVF